MNKIKYQHIRTNAIIKIISEAPNKSELLHYNKFYKCEVMKGTPRIKTGRILYLHFNQLTNFFKPLK